MNGIDALTGLFQNEKELIQHIVYNTLFFNPVAVEKQNQNILQRIENGEAIPVRYTSNKHFVHRYKKRTERIRYKNKKTARKDEGDVFHRETGIKVHFDSDGNTTPRQAIYDCSNHWVSFGDKTTLTNYTIAHIWGETHNPLFFSAMWNYCVIPTPFTFLTDKKSEANDVAKKLQDLIKAISIKLYSPNAFLKSQNKSIDIPNQEILYEAELLIKSGKIKFIPINN